MILPSQNEILKDYSAPALKQLVKDLSKKTNLSGAERDTMIISRQLYFEKTGVPLSDNELNKN